MATINKTDNAYECVYRLTQSSNQFEKTVKSNITDINAIRNTMTEELNPLLIALLTQSPSQTASPVVPQPAPNNASAAITQNAVGSGAASDFTYHQFKVKAKKEKGVFLGMESMSFKKIPSLQRPQSGRMGQLQRWPCPIVPYWRTGIFI